MKAKIKNVLQKSNKEDDQKTCKITFRLTHKEKDVFMEQSKKANMSPSELLRRSIRNARITSRLNPAELEIYKQILRIGHNINTILKLAHIAKINAVEGQCKEALHEINKHLRRLSDDW